MNRRSGEGLRAVLAACACAALMQGGALFAEGVTRAVESVPGGCRVTLAWTFSGTAESDLVLEERLAPGWTVDGATVPFAALDASWLSGAVARFAVKPALLAQPGSITFTVVSGEGAAAGAVAGDWKMYLGGTLRKGAVAGANALAARGAAGADGPAGAAGGATGATETAGAGVAITSFKVLNGAAAVQTAAGGGARAAASAGGVLFAFAYAGVARDGTLVVEGCERLGGAWTAVKRVAAAAGEGTVTLAPGEAGENRFFRLKVVTEEE